jgi:hypothetical protein
MHPRAPKHYEFDMKMTVSVSATVSRSRQSHALPPTIQTASPRHLESRRRRGITHRACFPMPSGQPRQSYGRSVSKTPVFEIGYLAAIAAMMAIA